MQLQQHAPVDDIDEGEQESEQKRKKKSAPKIQKPKKLPVKRKLHLHNDKETMPSQTTFSNAPVIQTQTNTSLEKPSNLKCNSGIALHKIPRTTTDRKKIVQTNKPMVDAMVVSESEFNKAVRRLEARDAQVGRTYETGETSRAAVEDDMDEGAEVEDYIGEGAVLEDFIGEGDELDNEMNEDAQLDDDMEEEEEIGCVQDTYDPYSSNCWQRGLYADETYFSRLYRNAAEQRKARAKNTAKKTSQSSKHSAPKSTSTANPPDPPRRFTRSSLQSLSQPHPSINTTQTSYEATQGPSSQPVTRTRKGNKGKNKV
uniref:Uncharacterized protein n=1 Tax=Chenopodium quinoa TaxID=63459 RepID=A0A803MVE4_CHEQI